MSGVITGRFSFVRFKANETSCLIMLTEHPSFFTATIVAQKHLLKPDKYKAMVIKSLPFLVEKERIKLFGFVIMPNHIPVIWQMRENRKPADGQRDFLKYTAQQIKFDLLQNHPAVLEHFGLQVKDRSYQLWEHRPLSVPLWSKLVFEQKLDYLYQNPVQEKWWLADLPENYYYSSARYYLLNVANWGFLTHYAELVSGDNT